MVRDEEIERLLRVELTRARMEHDIAEQALRAAFNEDGLARIEVAASANAVAMNAWIESMQEFSGFILDGTVPDRFKVKGKIPTAPTSSVTTPRIESRRHFGRALPRAR
jgi:hypothetical protein